MIVSDKERQAPLKIEEAEPTHLARYKFAGEYISKRMKVLDAPCGSGYGTKFLALKGAEVYGVDINEGAIGHAKEFFSDELGHFYVGDIENMRNIFNEDKFFDAVVSFEGIEHLKNPDSFLSEAERLLKPDGIFMISTPRKPHGSPFHIKEYSLDEFKDLLSGRFAIKEIYGQIYTEFHDLFKEKIDPNAYQKFNFIAVCSPKKI